MENKEVITVIIVLAVIFSILSITSDIAITGSSIKETNSLSLTFSMITIVLIAIILISVMIELIKFTRKN